MRHGSRSQLFKSSHRARIPGAHRRQCDLHALPIAESNPERSSLTLWHTYRQAGESGHSVDFRDACRCQTPGENRSPNRRRQVHTCLNTAMQVKQKPLQILPESGHVTPSSPAGPSSSWPDQLPQHVHRNMVRKCRATLLRVLDREAPASRRGWPPSPCLPAPVAATGSAGASIGRRRSGGRTRLHG